MSKKILGFFAAGIFTATVIVAFTITPTQAGSRCGIISCAQPTGVGRGNKAPVWKVAYCVVGNTPGNYRKVNCKSSEAVHLTPTGNMGVCFVGTDGKVHWDYQYAVYVGARFINRKVGGRWQPDWQG